MFNLCNGLPMNKKYRKILFIWADHHSLRDMIKISNLVLRVVAAFLALHSRQKKNRKYIAFIFS